MRRSGWGVHNEASLYPCSEDSTVGCAVAEKIRGAIEALDLTEIG